jgi:prevent-host-death family protein
MAVVSIRTLLRNAAAIFEGIDRDQEPVLITRHGRPFAALVPVDPDDAETMILSSVPEFVESRRRAENARAEGRTTSLEDALRDFGAEAGAVPALADVQVAGNPLIYTGLARGPITDLALVLGVERAEEVDRIALQRVHQITSDVLESAGTSDLVSPEDRQRLIDRIESLNERLIRLRLRHELARHLFQGIWAIAGSSTAASVAAASSGGLLGKSLTDAVIVDAATFVDSINMRNVEVSKRAGRLSPEIFESSLSASVSALERSDQEAVSSV